MGEGPIRELFKEQEQERYELRMKHVVEKEKLVLAVEQVDIVHERFLMVEINNIVYHALYCNILSICIILGNIESPW